MNKKVILGLVVVVAFGGYIAYQKMGKAGNDDVHVVAPSSLTSMQTSANTTADNSASAGSAPPSTQTGTGSAGGTATAGSSGPATAPKPAGMYKDGVYTGNETDAYYGNIKIQVTVSGGKITDVAFLDYPQDRRTSQQINQQAMPYLKQEAIQAQSANIDIVSGATQTSQAFIQSLGQILSEAKA